MIDTTYVLLTLDQIADMTVVQEEVLRAAAVAFGEVALDTLTLAPASILLTPEGLLRAKIIITRNPNVIGCPLCEGTGWITPKEDS